MDRNLIASCVWITSSLLQKRETIWWKLHLFHHSTGKANRVSNVLNWRNSPSAQRFPLHDDGVQLHCSISIQHSAMTYSKTATLPHEFVTPSVRGEQMLTSPPHSTTSALSAGSCSAPSLDKHFLVVGRKEEKLSLTFRFGLPYTLSVQVGCTQSIEACWLRWE